MISQEDVFLAKLRLIPEDIILSMATREIKPSSCFQCVCGWAAREIVARKEGADAEGNYGHLTFYGSVLDTLSETLGGEWYDINGAYADPDELIALENAFADRVNEIVA